MNDNNSQKNLETSSNDTKNTLARRDFFRKSAALSATALAGTSIFAGTKAMADDPAIMNNVP